MNMEELLLPPTDAAAYMQNLVFTYGEEVHTEEDSAWGLLDTMFSVVPDKLAGVKRGFIRTENGIEMIHTTPEQERAVQSKREEFGSAFAAALLPWLAGWEQLYINTRNLDVLDIRPWHEYGVTILYNIYHAFDRTLAARQPLNTFSDFWGFRLEPSAAYSVMMDVKRWWIEYEDRVAKRSGNTPNSRAYYKDKLWPQYPCAEAEAHLARVLSDSGYKITEVTATLTAVRNFFDGKPTDAQAFLRYWDAESLYGSDLLWGGYEYWDYVKVALQNRIDERVQVSCTYSLDVEDGVEVYDLQIRQPY